MKTTTTRSLALTGKQCRAFGEALVGWFHQQGASLPWRQDYERTGDPYYVWLSEVMLQQTLIKAVIPKYRQFTQTLPTIADLAAADEPTLRPLVAGLGYYRRFRLFYLAAIQVHQQGYYPNTYKSWIELPGIGPYTASALASICNDEPVAVVDGNVERVLCRIGDIQEPVNLPSLKPFYLEAAQKLLEGQPPSAFNQGLMELGQRHCRPTKPDCTGCPVSTYCQARKNGTIRLAPKAKIKKSSIPQEMRIVVPVNTRGEIGLIERSETAKFLRGTWGFPLYLPGQDGAYRLDGLKKSAQWLRDASSAHPIGTVSHSITHHKIRAKVYRSTTPPRSLPLKWIPRKQAQTWLVSSLDKKALAASMP